MLRELGEERK
jgi:hypothetical protein